MFFGGVCGLDAGFTGVEAPNANGLFWASAPLVEAAAPNEKGAGAEGVVGPKLNPEAAEVPLAAVGVLGVALGVAPNVNGAGLAEAAGLVVSTFSDAVFPKENPVPLPNIGLGASTAGADPNKGFGSGGAPNRDFGGSTAVDGCVAPNVKGLGAAGAGAEDLLASVAPKRGFGASMGADAGVLALSAVPNPANMDLGGSDFGAASEPDGPAEGNPSFSFLGVGLPKLNGNDVEVEEVAGGAWKLKDDALTELVAEDEGAAGREKKDGIFPADPSGPDVGFSSLSKNGFSLSLIGVSLACSALDDAAASVLNVNGGAGGKWRGPDTTELAKKLGMPVELVGTDKGLDAADELAKKLGMPLELAAVGCGVVPFAVLLPSLDPRGAPSGGASPNERDGLNKVSPPNPVKSAFSLREGAASGLLVSGCWAGLVKENGREVIGGSLAFVKSFCSG